MFCAFDFSPCINAKQATNNSCATSVAHSHNPQTFSHRFNPHILESAQTTQPHTRTMPNAMADPDSKLDHIYFFMSSTPALSIRDAKGVTSSAATSNRCPSPTSGPAAVSNQSASAASGPAVTLDQCASPNTGSAATSNQCASPGSEVASLSSSNTKSDTAASNSGSNLSKLNPNASDFTPTSSPTKLPVQKPNKLYELQQTVGKGYGLFATAFIPIGTRIICEAPLIRLPENQVHLAWEAYGRLTKKQKAAYNKLHYFKPEHMNLEGLSRSCLIDYQDETLNQEDIDEMVLQQVRVMGTFAANNFATGRGLSVFETSARLNHSCVPNVHHSFNPTLQKQTVHAVRDIFPGEELLTTYLGGEGSYIVSVQRKEILRQGYGFICMCPACSHPSTRSDARRELLGALAWGLQQFIDKCNPGQSFVPASPAFALQQAEAMVSLLIEEGLLSMELIKAYRTASTQALNIRDFSKAIEYAYNEAEVERNCMGVELDDLKKMGADSASWIAQVRERAASFGVNLGKAKKKYQKAKALDPEEQNLKTKKRSEANKRKAAAKRGRKEMERAAEEAERQKKEYDASYPDLKA